MTAPGIDERDHRDALETLLTATLGANRVYDYGKVPGADNNPGTLPDIFTLLAVERRFVPTGTSSGVTGRTGWRITVRHIGRTVDEARWAAMKVTQALDSVRLTVDGHTSTPITHESTQAIAADDGRFSGYTAWIYAL